MSVTKLAPTGASGGTATASPSSSSQPSDGSCGTLGTFSIVMMVVAAAAPLAVVAATVPVMITATESAQIPLYFLCATVILVLFSVGFTSMTKYVKNAGAFYSYIKAGLGRIPGVGSATLALGAYFFLLLAVYCLLGVLTANAVETFTGAVVPWYVFTAIAWVLVTILGYLNIDLSAKVLGVALVAEALVVLVMSVAIIAKGGAEGLTAVPLSPAGVSPASFGFGLMFAVLGFIGFEATAVFRREAKDPDKTVPRATYIAVIAIGVFYAFASFAIVNGVGLEKLQAVVGADPDNAVLHLADTYVGTVLFVIMQVLIVTSSFACLLAFHNVITRYMFTLGGFKILPARLVVLNQKQDTPSFASGTLSAVSLVALIVMFAVRADPYVVGYTWFSGSATLGLLALMGLTNVAVIVFFRRISSAGIFATVVAPALSLIGMSLVVYMVVANFAMLVGNEVAADVLLVVLAAFFLAGVVIALVMRARDPRSYALLGESIDKHRRAAAALKAGPGLVPEPVRVRV